MEDQPLETSWTYGRLAGGQEACIVQGQDVGLPPHFHIEDQLTFVLSGRRRFVLGQHCIALDAGRGVILPAGTTHRPLPEDAGIVCINLYLPAGSYDGQTLVAALERHWQRRGKLSETDLAAFLATHTVPTAPLGFRAARMTPNRAGMTREAFSRAFARSHGMPPHAFDIATRLNLGRRRLQLGESLVSTALESGFVDQSHFGRSFKRLFGTSPGRYRSGYGITRLPDARHVPM